MSAELNSLRASMLEIITSKSARPRERTAAARVLVSAARLVNDAKRLRAELHRWDPIGTAPTAEPEIPATPDTGPIETNTDPGGEKTR